MAATAVTARQRILTALTGLHLLIVGATFGGMVVVGPLLPQVMFYKLGLEPLTAARYMGVIFQQLIGPLYLLAGAAVVVEALRLAFGERPHWAVAGVRYVAAGVVLAAVVIFGRYYVPAVQAYQTRGADALASPAFHALHEGSRRVFATGLLAAGVALILVPRR
ncbi:MAG: hypothetical protein PVF51_06440 [Nitrospirota bacterium]|jgi:hypothetical protein